MPKAPWCSKIILGLKIRVVYVYQNNCQSSSVHLDVQSPMTEYRKALKVRMSQKWKMFKLCQPFKNKNDFFEIGVIQAATIPIC